MKEVKPGVWVDYDLHFELSEEEKKWLEKKNEETRKILNEFLTELQKSDRMPIKITIYE